MKPKVKKYLLVDIAMCLNIIQVYTYTVTDGHAMGKTSINCETK